MKIAIFEYVHFQYALTMTELFEGDEFVYIYSSKIKDAIKEFRPDFDPANEWVYEKDYIKENYQEIIKKINNEGFDLICINPIFDNFYAYAQIAKKTKAKKLLTTHNINNWFRQKFRSPKGYRERRDKLQIIKYSDYIAVEDFIYQYLKDFENDLFSTHNFIYIPYTFFSPVTRLSQKNFNKIKIVLPGSIDKERRRYEVVLDVMPRILARHEHYVFSFAGPIYGEYGKVIEEKLEKIKANYPQSVVFFKEKPKPEEFRQEMETADAVLSTSTTHFYGLGRTAELIGKTKPTAAIHDMMTYELPGFLPAHLTIPENLKTSSISYKNAEELYNGILRLNDKKYLNSITEEAKKNSRKFTANEIRKHKSFPFKLIQEL